MAASVRIAAAAIILVASPACTRDEDLVDDPIRPQNVAASLEACDTADTPASAVVEVTNGTGHASAYDVTVTFRRRDAPPETAVERSSRLEPGQSEQLQVRAPADTTDIDGCDLDLVEEVAG